MGDNYRKVDLTANAFINVGDDLDVPNMDTYSINSNTSTNTLYTFQSDTIGNITKIGNVTLDWNGRRLESISQSGTELISYEYNMDGQRVKKTVDGVTTEYFYNGSILAGQRTGNDEIVFMYDNNDDVFGFEYNGTPYYYVKNAQNDVILIVDENNQPKVIYQYDAWGKIVECLDGTDFGLAGINPIMYRSYYADLELGMFIYYLNSRYYVADWGRFASADTTDILSVQSDLYDKNLFAYCDNNPVHRVDTTGFVWETVFDVASLGVSIVEVAINPTDVWAWAGLVGDALDLVPFVTGIGEITRAVKVSSKFVDGADNVVDAAKATKRVVSKTTGAYEITFKSGKNYVGKGSFNRAIKSAEIHAKPNLLNNFAGDSVTSISWRASKNSKMAFVEEYALQTRRGVGNNSTYNLIWSPGKKYYSILEWLK